MRVINFFQILSARYLPFIREHPTTKLVELRSLETRILLHGKN